MTGHGNVSPIDKTFMSNKAFEALADEEASRDLGISPLRPTGKASTFSAGDTTRTGRKPTRTSGPVPRSVSSSSSASSNSGSARPLRPTASNPELFRRRDEMDKGYKSWVATVNNSVVTEPSLGQTSLSHHRRPNTSVHRPCQESWLETLKGKVVGNVSQKATGSLATSEHSHLLKTRPPPPPKGPHGQNSTHHGARPIGPPPGYPGGCKQEHMQSHGRGSQPPSSQKASVDPLMDRYLNGPPPGYKGHVRLNDLKHHSPPNR